MPTRLLSTLLIAVSLGAGSGYAEDATQPAGTPGTAPALPSLRAKADAHAAEGLTAMREAEADPKRGIDAAIAFGHALNAYESLNDVDAVCEMQANIYWCKKKMNLDDLKAYVAAKPEHVRQEMTAAATAAEKVMTVEVAVSESVAYLERAEKYRAEHAANHFQIAIRFSEIIERFPDSDEAKTASVVFVKEQSAYLAQVAEERKKEKEQFAAEIGKARKSRFMLPPPVIQGTPSAIPDKASYDAGLASVKKAYKDDYTRAKKDPQKRALARKLVAEAENSRDDAISYFVMLDEAQRLATETEDYETLLASIERRGATYEKYDQAAAKRDAVGRLKGRATAAQILKLLDDPADKPANTAVGKFYCYNLGRWSEGLPMLALGADADLAKVAEMELADPRDAPERKKTGDAWYDIGKKASKDDRLGAWTRAQLWFGKALPGLTGVTKGLLEKRIDEIEAVLPPVIADYENITPKQWERLKGTSLVVEGRVDRSDGKLTLTAGQRMRVVPHPTDEWQFESYGEKVSCTWRGTDPFAMMMGDDEEVQPRRRTRERGGFQHGALKVKVGTQEEVKPGIVSGPGHIWLMPHRGYGGVGAGAIRVKLVAVTDEE